MGRGGIRLDEVVRSGLDTFIDDTLGQIWIMGNPPEGYSAYLWKWWVDKMLRSEKDPEAKAFFKSIVDIGGSDPSLFRHIEVVVFADSTSEALERAEEIITQRLKLPWLEDVVIFD